MLRNRPWGLAWFAVVVVALFVTSGNGVELVVWLPIGLVTVILGAPGVIVGESSLVDGLGLRV
jgi:hypothetical protein